MEIRNSPRIGDGRSTPTSTASKVRIATPALVALIDAVETIHRAYNYSNSDPMTDYFERRYWGSVSTDPTIHIRRRR